MISHKRHKRSFCVFVPFRGTFKRDTAKIVRQLKKTGLPVVLTVNGRAELVVQDAESYRKAHTRGAYSS